MPDVTREEVACTRDRLKGLWAAPGVSNEQDTVISFLDLCDSWLTMEARVRELEREAISTCDEIFEDQANYEKRRETL